MVDGLLDKQSLGCAIGANVALEEEDIEHEENEEEEEEAARR